MSTTSSSTEGWLLDTAQQGLSSLRYESTVSVRADQLGPEDVLVEIRAASLNYRDLAITRGKVAGPVPLLAEPNVILGSDGAGVVIAVGSAVTHLKPGANIVTHMVSRKADEHMPTMVDICDGLGQKLNGTLCRRGVFHYSCLVPMPENLGFEEAATLTCSGLTAWNALMGMPGREVKEGDWILVQGTGGVSVAALQIAIAAGANVIATTSTDARAEKLSSLGALHVINYRTHANWGEIAKSFTPNQRGVDHVVEVAGVKSLSQSCAALRPHGLITIAGFVGGGDGNEKDPGIMSALWQCSTYRGIILGSRKMFLDMVKFVEEKNMKPAVDDVVFALEDAIGGLERLQKSEHFSKVVIKMG